MILEKNNLIYEMVEVESLIKLKYCKALVLKKKIEKI
jgi:hypothetical protein